MPQKDIGRRYLLLSVWMLRFSSVKIDPVRFAAAVIGLVSLPKKSAVAGTAAAAAWVTDQAGAAIH